MKLEFETSEFKNPNMLGTLLMMFSDFYHGGLYHTGFSSDWTQTPTLDRKYIVAVMGDQIYDELENTKYRHWYHKNGLHVVTYFEGDDVILFFKEGDDGFAIINSKNGINGRWEVADFNDPRNDPNYDPFEESGYERINT